MNDLDDLIRFENENRSLDFKAIQYLKPAYEDMIKDVMALANADVEGDRYIIIGVKAFPDGSREFRGIEEKEFLDAATYQQLIRENIEPDIHFEYTPHRFDGHLLGVFRIHDCVNQPYMMRKDYGRGLKQGDAFIRKGTFQHRMTRSDFDRIFRGKTAAEGFTGVIRIGFDIEGAPMEINLPAIGDIKLPSDRAAERIQQILSERRMQSRPGLLGLRGFELVPSLMLGQPTPYEHRSTDALMEDLANIKETYEGDDNYELYEVHGTTLNFRIINESDTYVEDATLQVKFPRIDGLLVADRVHHKPNSDWTIRVPIPEIGLWKKQYPAVIEHNDYIQVRADLGDIRHRLPKRAFHKSLRILFEESLVGQTLRLKCTLHGKQLRTPRQETLIIHVKAPVTAAS